MRKLVLCLLISCTFMSLYAEKEKRLYSKTIEYKEVYLYNYDKYPEHRIVTYNQLAEDMDNLAYLFETAYIDYDSMVKKGFNSRKMVSSILAKYKDQEEVETKNVYLDVIRELEPYVNDSHCAIIFFRDRKFLCKKNSFFYTNTFVEKTEKGSVIYESDSDRISKGMKFTGSEENLFYYPAKGRKVYRVGVLSVEKPEVFYIAANDKDVPVEIYDDSGIECRPFEYHEMETKKTGYVSISSFMPPDENSSIRKSADTALEKYSNLGLKWGRKKNIIIDLRTNCGGLINYSADLFAPLYTDKIKDMNVSTKDKINTWINNNFYKTEIIESPATVSLNIQDWQQKSSAESDKTNANYDRFMYKRLIDEKVPVLAGLKVNPTKNFYSCISDSIDDVTENKPSFKGTIILLIGRNTASAAELTVALAQKLFGNTKQVYVVGENSRGCMTFENVEWAVLKNSGIGILLAFNKMSSIEDYPSWHGEGRGFYPDCWANGEDLNDTVFMLTKDREMKKNLMELIRL